MNSLRIDFGADGARLVLDEQVTGTLNTAQKCLLNMGVIRGSAGIFPDKGTDLLTQAVRGELISTNAAQHAANFAALDTLVFTRTNDPQDNLEDTSRTTDIRLTVASFAANSMGLDAYFTFADGTTLGLQPTLTLT